MHAPKDIPPQQKGGSLLLDEDGLNGSQIFAVAQAMLHPITLIQGPPGTGKTTTIVRFLKRVTQMGFKQPILACAQSNVAVDNLLEVGLIQR